MAKRKMLIKRFSQALKNLLRPFSSPRSRRKTLQTINKCIRVMFKVVSKFLFETGWKHVGNFLLLVGIGVLVFNLCKAVWSTSITVNPIPAPETFVNHGYTPEVFAARVAAEMMRIDRDAQLFISRLRMNEGQSDIISRPPPCLIESKDQPDIQIPGGPLSFQTLVQYARELFGTENIAVSIDVTADKGDYIAQIRIDGGPYDGSREIVKSPKTDNTDAFVLKVANNTMRVTEPYILACYKMSIEEGQCGRSSSCAFSESQALLKEILARLPFQDDKWALLGQGYVQEQQNRYEEAMKSYQKAIELDPKFAPAYNNWGVVLYNLGRDKEAIGKFKKAVELDPKFASAYNNWGAVLSDLGQPKEAIKKYKKAIKLNPKFIFAYNDWGAALAKLERYEEAIKKYKKAIELDPRYALPYGNYCGSLNMLGRNEEAIEKCKKAIELDPKYANAYNNWGHTLATLERYEEAIEKYQKAIELDPKFAFAYDNWGIALSSLGRYEEAIEKHQKAIKLNPKFANSYNNWGVVLCDQGKYIEALEKYQKAIELDPKYANAYYTWGGALSNLGRDKEAIEKFKKAVELDPKYAPAYNNWGAALSSLGRDKEAIEKCKKAIELNPKYAFPYGNWGAALYNLGRYEEAIGKFKKAVELDPNLTPVYYTWGSALSKLGRYEEAIEKYKKAIELDPKYPYSYNSLAWLLATCLSDRHRNGKLAIEMAEKAVALKDEADFLDTLAAAYAERGRFQDAIKTQERSIRRLKKKGDIKKISEFEKHLASYKAGKPWREK